MTPPLTGDALARICEQTEASHLAEQVHAFARLRPVADARVLPFAGGIAVLSAPEFGHKLNRVTGAALDGPLDAAAIAALERSFEARATGLEIDLCPYADPGAWPVLAARGYTVESFTNTYAIELATLPDAPATAPDLEIAALDRGDAETFVAAAVAAFSARPSPRSPALLETLARIALLRPRTELFVARSAGTIAATAALALLETSEGTVAHLFLASTLPAARNRGVQRALLSHRLRRARALGARFATVAARPATTSARNTERAGLRLVYNKPTLRRPA